MSLVDTTSSTTVKACIEVSSSQNGNIWVMLVWKNTRYGGPYEWHSTLSAEKMAWSGLYFPNRKIIH